jgi:hypothetical protein
MQPTAPAPPLAQTLGGGQPWRGDTGGALIWRPGGRARPWGRRSRYPSGSHGAVFTPISGSGSAGGEAAGGSAAGGSGAVSGTPPRVDGAAPTRAATTQRQRRDSAASQLLSSALSGGGGGGGSRIWQQGDPVPTPGTPGRDRDWAGLAGNILAARRGAGAGGLGARPGNARVLRPTAPAAAQWQGRLETVMQGMGSWGVGAPQQDGSGAVFGAGPMQQGGSGAVFGAAPMQQGSGAPVFTSRAAERRAARQERRAARQERRGA